MEGGVGAWAEGGAGGSRGGPLLPTGRRGEEGECGGAGPCRVPAKAGAKAPILAPASVASETTRKRSFSPGTFFQKGLGLAGLVPAKAGARDPVLAGSSEGFRSNYINNNIINNNIIRAFLRRLERRLSPISRPCAGESGESLHRHRAARDPIFAGERPHFRAGARSELPPRPSGPSPTSRPR